MTYLYLCVLMLLSHVWTVILLSSFICCIYYLFYLLNLQEGDQFTAESAPSCHRCPATKQQFLATDCPLAMKTTKDTRAAVTAAASGDGLRALGLRGMGTGPVVEWNEDGSCVRPGTESSHYEAGRSECGAHLLFNAFWTVAHCCVHQLLLRDSMHQIDLVLSFAISWQYSENIGMTSCSF